MRLMLGDAHTRDEYRTLSNKSANGPGVLRRIQWPNKELELALADLLAAVRASRLRFALQRERHPDVFRFLDQLK